MPSAKLLDHGDRKEDAGYQGMFTFLLARLLHFLESPLSENVALESFSLIARSEAKSACPTKRLSMD